MTKGDYYLMVRGNAGPFTLNAKCSQCEPDDLKIGDAKQGRLTADSCQEREVVQGGDNSLVQVYRLELRLPATVNISLTNQEDEIRAIVRPTGRTEKVAEGVSIRQQLDKGAYDIMVKAPRAGAYRISAGVECRVRTLQPGDELRDSLSESDCYEGAGFYHKTYKVPEPEGPRCSI